MTRYSELSKSWNLNIRRVLVWGAGGHSREVQQAILARHCHVIVRSNYLPDGKPFYIEEADIQGLAGLADGVHVAIGDPYVRCIWLRKFRALGMRLLVVAHPDASIAENAEIREGSYIGAGAVVQPCTIGEGVIVNGAAYVAHDCRLGDYVHLAPRSVLCGEVNVSACATVYAGAVAAPRSFIGTGAILGAMSFLMEKDSVPNFRKFAGIPAKDIGKVEDGESKHTKAIGANRRGAEAVNQGAGNS